VRLQTEFADAFDVETVERLVCSSYEKLAAHATVFDFLPLLAERFARQQLHASAKINGKSNDYQLVVLFLCNHNAGRSQMAMGFFNHLAGGGAVVWSGGSEPKGEINPAAITMAERGIDISGRYPKPWTGEIIQAADVIVSMGCGDTGPTLPGHDPANPRRDRTPRAPATRRPANSLPVLTHIAPETSSYRMMCWCLGLS
jgi:arsenate reductase (thioredoxin)